MKLSKLLEGVAEDDKDIDVKNITTDSRKVIEGSLFIAYGGVTVDGHEYITQATEKGAEGLEIGWCLSDCWNRGCW